MGDVQHFTAVSRWNEH